MWAWCGYCWLLRHKSDFIVSGGVKHIIVQKDDSGMRLDRWFRQHYPHLAYVRLEKLLRKGLVRVDGGRCKANIRLVAGQSVRVPPEAQGEVPRPRRTANPAAELIEQIKAAILYKDDDILALNKPSGLAVQGGSKTHMHLDAVLPYLQFEQTQPPRLVHRLDRDTSGVLLLARTRQAASYLTRIFARREVEKIYWGLVYGVPRPARGHIDLPLRKQAAQSNRERVLPAEKNDTDAQSAFTDYAVIARAAQKFAWVAFRPQTGRTHQIRAHATAIGHALVGDQKYHMGEQQGGILPEGLHLHAFGLTLQHPHGQKQLHITAPLRGHMAETWRILGFDLETKTDIVAGKIFED